MAEGNGKYAALYVQGDEKPFSIVKSCLIDSELKRLIKKNKYKVVPVTDEKAKRLRKDSESDLVQHSAL